MQLPLPGPRFGCSNMYLVTSTFSPPLSHLTLDGRPKWLTPSKNVVSIVSSLLLVEALRKTTNREYPSMPPCTRSLHRTSLWWPSICYRLLGIQTLYCLRCKACLKHLFIPLSSTLRKLSRTLDCCTRRPAERKNP